jgi:hypothetical protein
MADGSHVSQTRSITVELTRQALQYPQGRFSKKAVMSQKNATMTLLLSALLHRSLPLLLKEQTVRKATCDTLDI